MEEFERGIPRLAAYLDSNESFCIFQRFGPYAARILLHREIELSQLVEELNKLDAEDAAKPEMIYRLTSAEYYEGMDNTQRKLLLQIETKIGEYCEMKLCHDLQNVQLEADRM